MGPSCFNCQSRSVFKLLICADLLKTESRPDENPQLLLDIHFYACAPALPLTSRFLYDVYHHTSPAYKAAWLHNRLVVNSPSTKKPSAKKRAAVLSAALSHPICDRKVFQLFYKRFIADGSEVKRGRVELPKRWFKPSDDTSAAAAAPAPLEFMLYLFDEGLANPKYAHLLLVSSFSSAADDHHIQSSHAGFPLARAVLDKNRQLIDLLLSRGACPAENNWIAISFAVKKRSLELTKELFHKRQKAEDPLACQ